MNTRVLTSPVPAPSSRRVRVVRGRSSPFLRGPGETDYACGGCGAGLVQGVAEGSMLGVIFQCSVCDSFSRVDLSAPTAAES